MSRLAGQLALVTGASGAIGGALARSLAHEGADLVLAGRNAARLRAVAADLGSRVRAVAALDLAEAGAAAALARRTLDLGSGLDLLAHAAGLFLAGDVEQSTDADFARILQVNVQAPLALTRALLTALRERHGQIVFVNSSVVGRRGVGLYAASKHALRALADSLRDEVNRDGVRVVSVYPGRTASAMQQEVHRSEGRDYDPARLVQPADVAQTVLGALLAERSVEVTDLHLRPMLP